MTHDKLTCYTDHGCRLPACRERYNAWQREYRLRRGLTKWSRGPQARRGETPFERFLRECPTAPG